MTEPKPVPNLKEPRSWTLTDSITVRTIRVSHGEAVWQLSDVHESHDPMDRVGGPFRLSSFVDDDRDGEFFLFVIQDSYFPPVILVRANGMEAAMEAFCDWIVEGVSENNRAGRYGLVVTEDEMDDYDEDSSHVEYASGYMVDVDNVVIQEAKFHSCEA